MGILQVDILLKSAFEAAIADLRKNPYILDDIFGGLEPDGLAHDSLSKAEYGTKEVEVAKQWFHSNNIFVIQQFRTDAPEFPAISIVRGPAREMLNRTSLADDGRDEDYDPVDATVTPQKVYENFTPKAYDKETGTITLPDSLNTFKIVAGQYLVSVRSGRTYLITARTCSHTFTIMPGINDDFTDAYIAPPILQWNLRREQTYFEETFYIGCHAQSDSVQCIWLSMIVEYILLRYKEAYLEARGFELSTFSWAPIVQNPEFTAEMVFSRSCTLTGQVEKSWIKYIAPKLQDVRGGVVISDAPATPSAYIEETLGEGIITEGDTEITVLGEDED